MSKTAPLRTRRPNAEYRWTRARILAFLDALVAHGSVSGASHAVGMSRNSAYRLRARFGTGFAEAWDEALTIAVRVRLERETEEFDRLAAPLFAR